MAGLVLMLALVLASAPSSAAPLSERPLIRATALYLIELKSGRILLEKDAARRLPPASLTKIMTALVAMEATPPLQVVPIDQRALLHPSSLRFQVGEHYHLRDLVAAMLVTSSNEACEAVALHVGGTSSQFVDLMNRRAAQLELTQTHFTNPCGFDAPDHYSTASDLARLTQAALKTPDFAMMVRTVERSIATVDGHRQIVLHTTNDLLRDPDVNGVKTGFTSRAGRCLIASMFKDGRQFLLVGLNVADRWEQAAQLLRYGQALFNDTRQ
jgi:serine-type D-Ala-D-Ala carboxypeptidase (penicillin-binding protein 5/6)